VVKFSATWCGPCRNAAPVYAELSLKHSDLLFVSIDVDELPVHQYSKFHPLISVFIFIFTLCTEQNKNSEVKYHLKMVLQELVTQFDVRATPTFIFMRDKKEIDKLVGGNHEDLQKKFDPYCQCQ